MQEKRDMKEKLEQDDAKKNKSLANILFENIENGTHLFHQFNTVIGGVRQIIVDNKLIVFSLQN